VRLTDLYPLQGTFKPGQMSTFCVIVHVEETVEAEIRLHIYHLESLVEIVSRNISLSPGEQDFTLSWLPPEEICRGYGIYGELLNEGGQVVDTAVTAFDVLDAWTSFPRYGFLSEFSPERSDIEQTVEKLLRYHINGLQFYDWQYRHDSLVSPTETYVDPLGRELSLATVRDFISAAHKYGMAAMPYLTVYAASLTFWREHPQWALYDDQGRPMSFMDFLGLMDPTAERPWSVHLINECVEVLATLPFDGLHIDQYGDPKEAFDVHGDPVNIPQAFSLFIQALKIAHPEAAITFNAVGNWPIAALASAQQDFVYIEVWPPATHYFDLVDIVLNARQKSGGKAVVIALYLPAERTANIRLADALIFSCGGARIELGEGDRLLTDPYFPNHQEISPELNINLQRYYDFAVRYQELFGPGAGMNESLAANLPDGIWQVARQSPGRVTLSLVNLIGVEGRDWDKDHSEPSTQREVSVRISIKQPVRHVRWASPDSRDLRLQPVTWQVDDNIIELTIPELAYWGILVFEFEETYKA
jgi:dextranase